VDGPVERAVHTFVLHHRWIADGSRVVTYLGAPLVVTLATVVVAVLLAWRRERRLALFVVATRIAAVVVSGVLKAVVHRPRPVLPHPVAHAHGYSFPSGHALGSAAFWGSIALVGAAKSLSRPVAAAVAVVVPVVVAATRVLLGVHYVTDVVGGLALGWACAAAAWRLTP
jgi:membrane-associated phospholipid phosphatase